VPRITDYCICIYVLVFGCKLSRFRLCDSDFGITPLDDITIGITWAAFCFHTAHISFASSWYLFCLSVTVLARLLLLLLLILLLLLHYYQCCYFKRISIKSEKSQLASIRSTVWQSARISACPTGRIFVKSDSEGIS